MELKHCLETSNILLAEIYMNIYIVYLTFYHITHRCMASLLNVAANVSVNSQPVNKIHFTV